jgi:hypothetical protein
VSGCKFTLPGMPLSLSDNQLRVVMETAANIDADRRAVYLQRIEAMLRLRRRFDDRDVADVDALACVGLVHEHKRSA